MNVDVIGFLLLAVLGVASALLGAAYLVFRIVAGIVGSASRIARPGKAIMPLGRRGSRQKALVCPQRACRYVEHRKALFCSQCGASLRDMKPEEIPVAG